MGESSTTETLVRCAENPWKLSRKVMQNLDSQLLGLPAVGLKQFGLHQNCHCFARRCYSTCGEPTWRNRERSLRCLTVLTTTYYNILQLYFRNLLPPKEPLKAPCYLPKEVHRNVLRHRTWSWSRFTDFSLAANDAIVGWEITRAPLHSVTIASRCYSSTDDPFLCITQTAWPHWGVLTARVKSRCSIEVVSSVSGQFPVNKMALVKCPCAFRPTHCLGSLAGIICFICFQISLCILCSTNLPVWSFDKFQTSRLSRKLRQGCKSLVRGGVPCWEQ